MAPPAMAMKVHMQATRIAIQGGVLGDSISTGRAASVSPLAAVIACDAEAMCMVHASPQALHRLKRSSWSATELGARSGHQMR